MLLCGEHVYRTGPSLSGKFPGGSILRHDDPYSHIRVRFLRPGIVYLVHPGARERLVVSGNSPAEVPQDPVVEVQADYGAYEADNQPGRVVVDESGADGPPDDGRDLKKEHALSRHCSPNRKKIHSNPITTISSTNQGNMMAST